MTTTLVNEPRVVREHHDRLVQQVNRLPELGELIDSRQSARVGPLLAETCTFLTELLLPHISASERVLYPQLERVLQNRHSMAPMRHEHDEIRSAVYQLLTLKRAVDAGQFGTREQIALRRAVFRLYALLKVHLAEELLYAAIVEHGASEETEQALAAAMDHPGITAS
jgi:iron-sulfur cluster repair protein YtfE (RIC family)